MNNGVLLGNEETQLNLEGPLEYETLLRTYYGFVNRGGITVLSSLSIDASGVVEVSAQNLAYLAGIVHAATVRTYRLVMTFYFLSYDAHVRLACHAESDSPSQ